MKHQLKTKTFLSLSFCILVGLLNQNCGQQSSFSIDDLAADHSPSMLDIDLPESQARIGDRVFIASVFADVFLPKGDEVSLEQAKSLAGDRSHQIAEYITSEFETDKDLPILKVIDDFILKKVVEFHGLCSSVDGDGACNSRNVELRKNAAEVQTVAPISVTREGYRLSVCNKILQNNRAVENMVKNINAGVFVSMQENDTLKIYNSFYPEREISQEAYDALSLLYQSLAGETDLDKWRTLAISICQSAGWQVL